MKHLIYGVHALVRLVRPSQGIHASPDGYARGLSGEFRRRRHRSRRVRRYAERIPFALVDDEDDVAAEGPVPVRVPAPRRPADAAPLAEAPRAAAFLPTAPAGATLPTSAASRPPRVRQISRSPHTPAVAPVENVVNVAVPAAIVRGRCFVSGRDTGARPVESRRLALAVLCALADQGHTSAPGRAAVQEKFAVGEAA